MHLKIALRSRAFDYIHNILFTKNRTAKNVHNPLHRMENMTEAKTYFIVNNCIEIHEKQKKRSGMQRDRVFNELYAPRNAIFYR